jgi:ketosteroid isomerase-like protein
MPSAPVLEAESSFFEALLAADMAALDAVLAPDFLLVDVMAGQVVPRAALIELVGSKELEFLEIARSRDDVVVRERPGLSVVVGRTRMTMRFQQGAQLTAHSRYTHVYVDGGDGWRMLSAQGTQEADPAAAG